MITGITGAPAAGPQRLKIELSGDRCVVRGPRAVPVAEFAAAHHCDLWT
jgi:hypothetical protein